MSDLECPARFLLVAWADASLAEPLRPQRVAAVYDAPPHADGPEALAGALGLPLRDMTRRLTVRDVAAEIPEALAVLRDLADLHRGETVVVAADGGPGEHLDVSVDGDGVDVRTVSPEDER